MNNFNHSLQTSAERPFTGAPAIPAEYPRPQAFRPDYFLLDGTWQLNGRPIRVPFPPEAPISGYTGKKGSILRYEKTFVLPETWAGRRILLHFGAVDQKAKVFLNGQYLGSHVGGYLHFTFDVTKAVRAAGENVLQVRAVDTNSTVVPYGKQSRKPDGMWYTGVSGIWQSVWLEAVPTDYIEKIKIRPDTKGAEISLYGADGRAVEGFTVTIVGSGTYEEGFPAEGDEGGRPTDGGEAGTAAGGGEEGHSAGKGAGETFAFRGSRGRVCPKEPRCWFPEDPCLYRIRIAWGEDVVYSYFGLRTVSLVTRKGLKRPAVNGTPVFLSGVLDQGYFPEGIFVPADLSEYDRDIEAMKDLGFNLLRKHIKVEPDYFYTACDRRGILVMQDMVQSGTYSFFNDTLLPYFQGQVRTDSGRLGLGQDPLTEGRRRKIFTAQTKGTVTSLYNHPSIIAWTVFNEGWGQFEGAKFYAMIKRIDPDRLVDTASGWFDQKLSDFDSRHQYFRNRLLRPRDDRPLFISECGGFGLDLSEHEREVTPRPKRISVAINRENPGRLQVHLERDEKTTVNIAVPQKLEPLQEGFERGEKFIGEKTAAMELKYDAAMDRQRLSDHRIEAVETIDLLRKTYYEKKGKSFQYGNICRNPDEVTAAILKMYREMLLPAISGGLCGFVYTQLSDVENEINGLYTYDRAVCKVNRARVAALNAIVSAWYAAETEA